MTTTNVGTSRQREGIDIELFTPSCVRIRSTWPVTTPRGDTSTATRLLSEALEKGIEAKCDQTRAAFFEVYIGPLWFYFHIAYKLAIAISSRL